MAPVGYALVGLWVAKKVAVFGVGQAYGWPRVYRRIMEANKRLNDHRSPEYAQARPLIFN